MIVTTRTSETLRDKVQTRSSRKEGRGGMASITKETSHLRKRSSLLERETTESGDG
jgi:hypothetical protein